MRLFTVTALVMLGKRRADMENTSFVADAEWKGYLSSAYGELYEEIVSTGLRHFEKVQELKVASTPLPTDYLATIGVDYIADAAGNRRALGELMVQERNRYRGTTGAQQAVAYTLEGPNIVLHPSPAAGQTYELRYIPQPADLTSANDQLEIDVVTPHGENFLAWSMAVIALAKEESDVSVAVAERERIRVRVIEWATLRAFNQPRRVIVEQEIGSWDEGDYRWGESG